MPLVKCKECGAKVSTSAKACPKCGEPDFINTTPKRASRIVKYGGPFVVVAILAAILSGNRARTEDPNVTAARSTADSIRAIARDPDSVKIERMLITPDSGTRCVQYQAKNGFGGTNRELVVIFRDRASKDLSDWTSHCPDSLKDYAMYTR